MPVSGIFVMVDGRPGRFGANAATAALHHVMRVLLCGARVPLLCVPTYS